MGICLFFISEFAPYLQPVSNRVRDRSVDWSLSQLSPLPIKASNGFADMSAIPMNVVKVSRYI